MGPAQACGLICVGDVLVAVGGDRVKGMSFPSILGERWMVWYCLYTEELCLDTAAVFFVADNQKIPSTVHFRHRGVPRYDTILNNRKWSIADGYRTPLHRPQTMRRMLLNSRYILHSLFIEGFPDAC